MASPSSRSTLAALELLSAVDSAGSISGAARVLGLSQPTVSEGLRRLERHLGLELVMRSTSGSTLTGAGRACAAWARELLDVSDRFEHSAAALREGPGRRVTIAASLTIAEYLAPRWLARRSLGGSARPEPDIVLAVCNSEEVMAMVLDARADLGFIEGPAVHPGLRHRTVGRDELVVVVAAGHPWTRRRTPLPVADLLAAPLVIRESGSGTRAVFENALREVGSHLPEHLPTLGSTAAAKTAVRHGGGVAVLSTLAVEDDVAQGSLVVVPVAGLAMRRTLRMVWSRSRPLPADVRALAADLTRPGRGTSGHDD